MTHTLDRLVGAYLPPGYVLEKCLAEEGDAAFYLTQLPGGPTSVGPSVNAAEGGGGRPVPRPALVKLVTAHAAVAGQLAAWERLAGISHPNVLALTDCGRAGPLGADGGHFLYAVFEYPDDRLESALNAGALTEADARDVMGAVESALVFLHEHGLAHTAVDERHVVAVGDRIKLSPDAVALLGPAATESADWKAAGALRIRLMDAVGDMATDAAAASPAVDAAPAAGDLDRPVAPGADASPEIAAERRPPTSLDSTADEPRRTMLPFWGYVALAIVAVFLLVLALRPKPAAPPVSASPVATSVPPATAQIPVETHASPTGEAADPANWRVVAYTYNKRKDADHKAAQISRKFPGFVPEVFSPNGAGRPPYLVALGGRMTRAQAKSLQREVLAKGMPAGTYIQNFRY